DFEEHVDEIKNLLYANFRKDIMRMASRGFPEWYKKKLLVDSGVLGVSIETATELARETLDQIEPIEERRIIAKENPDE
ncbi:hypothetical protein LCGC14_1109160, partial [marine sediment metagenome]